MIYFKVAQSPFNSMTMGGSMYMPLDFETRPSQRITVMVRDNGSPGQFLLKNFIIFINDVNDRPHSITLSNYTVLENQPIDTLVGTFSAEDEDIGQILTFSLIGGDKDAFYIDGRADLKIKANLSNYESKDKYELMVRVTDNGAIPAKVCFTCFIFLKLSSSHFDANCYKYLLKYRCFLFNTHIV